MGVRSHGRACLDVSAPSHDPHPCPSPQGGGEMSKPRALVIGGSLGGLIAAHLLRSTGWDATIFERNEEELASRGVGLGTHPQLIAILRRAGIAFDETMGIKVGKV